MATRRDVRNAFKSELKDVSGTYDVEDDGGNVLDTVTIEEGDIGLRNPDGEEPIPCIVYHDNYTPQLYNGVGGAPDDIRYNADGSVDAAIWKEYVEAQFIVDVRARGAHYKEPIYEAVHTQFARYQQTPWDPSDLHEDIRDISTDGSTTVDGSDASDVIRGDQVEVYVEFHRNYEFSTDNIEEVSLDVDADDDGSADDNYTIT